jgi:protease-4
VRSRVSAVALVAASCAALAACEGRAPFGSRARTDAAPDGSARAPEPAASASSSTPSSGSRRGSFDGPSIAEIDLSRGVPESRSTSFLGAPTRRAHVDLVRVLRALGEGGSLAASTKGVFVRIGMGGVGLSRAQEIGGLLGAIRKEKPVVCHADEYDNATLMLASKACSAIWVSPAGGVDSIGIAAQLLFANRLLERLHIAVDFLQVGKYKGAQEMYTRNEPSPEARESLEGTLRGLRTAWLGEIALGRGKLSAADAAEDGPFAPEDAKARGLVDAIGYLDEAREDLKKRAGVERVVPRFGGGESAPGSSRGLASVLRALAGSSHVGTPHIAVIPATGPISMSSSGGLLGGNDGITEHDLGRVVTKLTKDSATKAVVLRIDSPGGSALASDLLWKKLRKLAAEKPLVISVGDMAASGGYYLSCAGTKIVAEPTSIVGSIGVVGGKLAVGRALDEVGVHAEIVAAAPDPTKAKRASYMSSFTPWDDPTRERVLASMRSVYDLFLSRVAEGRGIGVDKVATFAEGRIFGGIEAKERGLVDQIGGLGDAIDLAIDLAKLPKDAPIDVVADEPALFDLLDESEKGGESAAPSGEAAMAAAQRAARDAILPPEWGAALPGARAFVGSIGPLLEGERALAALPYGIAIK